MGHTAGWLRRIGGIAAVAGGAVGLMALAHRAERRRSSSGAKPHSRISGHMAMGRRDPIGLESFSISDPAWGDEEL